MLKLLQKVLILTLLVIGALYLLYQGFIYYRSQDQLPPDTTVANLDVSGLTPEEAADELTAAYLAPIIIHHREERVELNPQDVGFMIDIEGMLQEAAAQQKPEEFWRGYAEFVIGRSLEPIDVELRATHDRDALLSRMDMLSSFLDRPATGPQFIVETESFVAGKPGYETDIEASLPDIEEALYSPDAREVELVVIDEEARPFNMDVLKEMVNQEIAEFSGMGSIFVMDLETGEEMSINADVALSGLSVVKIAILLETYRVLDDPPTADEQKLIEETAINSGNYSANLLLDVVAGMDNAYLGVDILTESMQRLGLVNTFIVTPYEEPNRPGQSTRTTPANSRIDVNTFPDPTMQTTAEDMGTLLSMIYYCAQGGGTLLAVYPGEITPDECQALLNVLARNDEGNLIRFGAPEGVQVSHKHGWAGNTHGDAGIVFSPGGDFVIVEYLTDPATDWLVHDISFPILREVARTVYNYFNVDDPYFGDPLEEDRPQVPGDQEVGAAEEDPAEETTSDEGGEGEPAGGGAAEATPTPPAGTPAPLPPGIEARFFAAGTS